MRFFNTAGPCDPDCHFMLPAAKRLDEVRPYLEQRGYFVLHAPRQSGKTTSVRELAKELTESGRFVSALLSVEIGEPYGNSPEQAEVAILKEWRSAARNLAQEFQPPEWPDNGPGRRIGDALEAWSRAAPRPLVLFIDEIDSLRDAALISLLRQLRSGYPRRPAGFPWSVGLIGMRDVRDYKVASSDGDRLHTASPFNIKVRSLTLAEFTADEVATLYRQHTDETGQPFADDALRLAYDLTRGQPWLVNALAKLAVEELVRDRNTTITAEHLRAAKDLLIQRQETHLDSLAERLREPRVRRIIEPMLAGSTLEDMPPDDIRFVLDLGLVRRDPLGGLAIANPIYQEVIPRVLASGTFDSLPRLAPTWLTSDGRLDPAALLDTFLDFWRQHGEPLLRSTPYAEVAPHLVLMAFLHRVVLHRVVNGGGWIEREYAIASGRLDLCLHYGTDRLAIELKVWRDGRPDPLSQGLKQLEGYLSGLRLDSGWLVIFDRRSNQPPIADRTTVESAATPGGRSVIVVRA